MDKPRLHVLVLEDDPLLQRSFARIIRRKGHEVVMTGTVEECRKTLLTAPPDVLLLDREVAGKDGWVMKREAPKAVRVVLMTGSPPPDAPPHLLKPMTVDELIHAIEGN